MRLDQDILWTFPGNRFISTFGELGSWPCQEQRLSIRTSLLDVCSMRCVSDFPTSTLHWFNRAQWETTDRSVTALALSPAAINLKQCRDLSAARALVLENAGCDMMETAPLTSSSADFEDMITQFRHRLRPPPALTLADWLRVNLGLSGATEDFDFPPRNEVHRQLRAVLRALT
jgi:hypothetical protein